MRQKTLVVGFVIFLLLVGYQSVLGKNVAESNVDLRDQDDATSQWVRDNYAFVMHAILPDTLELAPLPRNVKWVVVVSIQRPFSSPEYWMSMTRNYDGSVKATIKVPQEHSIAAQMKELKKNNPEITKDSVIKMLRVESHELSDANVSELRKMASSFEQMTFSPVMPDSLGSDLFAYHVWTESQFGQQMSVQLAGFGPDAKQQPHALVEWAERVRATTQMNLKRDRAGTQH